LTALMTQFIRDGRSTAGAPQKNDAPVALPQPPAATG
jgi:hypothetical protein